MLGLVGNRIVGFPTRRLINVYTPQNANYVKVESERQMHGVIEAVVYDSKALKLRLSVKLC